VSLPPAFLDELRARTPLAALVGRRVKLSRSGRNWKGCCPFHGEKTPSFYIYEDGYHCFGCGAHGDAVSFAMQTQGLTFPDAVAQLAAEAGLEVPKASPRAAEAERQRLDLGAVLEAAQASFARRLREPEGAAGLAYLHGRGLTDATIARFGLGWSGDGRGGLTREMGAQGVEPARLLEAGLLRESEGGERRELFFGRVTFPIRDRRGRVISFGGRTLGDGKPKYLNGPETALFHKRRTLFALDLAREGVRKDKDNDLIVVEGYMDTIALHQAGFTGAVAPLGTALTAEQFEELWSLSSRPILCFDGDAAGARAAERAIEIALSLLAPDRDLGVCVLPDDEDPDSYVRNRGSASMRAALKAARPLHEALFAALSKQNFAPPGRQGLATPMGEAQLLRSFEAAAQRISDQTLQKRFGQALRDLFYAGQKRKRGPARGHAAPPTPRPVPSAENDRHECIRNLIAILLHHPYLLSNVGDAFDNLDLSPPFARLREALHVWADGMQVLDSESLLSHLGASGLAAEVAQVLASKPLPLSSAARPDAMPAEAESRWRSFHGLLARPHLGEEVQAAGRQLAAKWGSADQQRVVALKRADGALLATESADDEE
jgi:DNA primase